MVILIQKRIQLHYRSISLLKLFKTIVTTRLENKLNFHQPIEQSGFRNGLGTNHRLQCTKTIIEKSIKYYRPLDLAFVDFNKAFDTVVLEALKECRAGYRYKNATMMARLHENTNAL